MVLLRTLPNVLQNNLGYVSKKILYRPRYETYTAVRITTATDTDTTVDQPSEVGKR